MQFATLRARSYLEAQLNQTLNDPYALALVTYALQVSGSSMVDQFLSALNSHATLEGTSPSTHSNLFTIFTFYPH